MTWQHVTWAAGAATAAALALACLPLLAATAGSARARAGQQAIGGPPAIGVLVIVVALVAAEVTLGDLVSPPGWAQAGWALLTATAAVWLAAHGRDLARPSATQPPVPATPSAPVSAPTAAAALATSVPAGPRMTDQLSEQDDLVQTLVIASFALQMGDERRAGQALERALRRSRATLDELTRQRGACQGFVRSTPALASRELPGPTAPSGARR